MGYGDPTLYSTRRPKKTEGGKKVLQRAGHKRGPQAVGSYRRRLSSGKVVLVKAHKRTATSVTRHEKAGKGYGVRERRVSGRLDYKAKQKTAKKPTSSKKTTRQVHIKSVK